MTAATKVKWIVMDGRAKQNTSDAAVLENLGGGLLELPPMKAAERNWKHNNSCLCFCRRIGEKKQYGPAEFFSEIK